MKKPAYFVPSLMSLAIILPILFQGLAIVAVFIAEAIKVGPWGHPVIFSLIGSAFLLICARAGRNAVRRFYTATGELPPPSFSTRYLPVLWVTGYTLLIAVVALLRTPSTTGAIFGKFTSFFGAAHLTSSFVIFMGSIFSVPSPWIFLTVPLAIYLAYFIGMVWEYRSLGAPRTSLAERGVVSISLLAVATAIVARILFMSAGVLPQGDIEIADSVSTSVYQPFTKDNRLVKIPQPSLAFAIDHPRLDGATAAYPVYAAAAQAIYQNVDEKSIAGLVGSSTTPIAYQKLIAGEVDVIFAARPSEQQRAAAEAAGRPLELTPIGREAFVFFVPEGNPVDQLTTEQIRGIYSKRFRNWSEVGGDNRKILAFQRPAGSGSQTALETKVMAGEKLPPPLREEFAEGMGGVIQRVAGYRNEPEAIGYSFRFFATTMNPIKGINLLKIDGIAPTRETIRSGIYPYTVDVFAITAGTKNPHAREIVDWFLSAEGQRLIDETGYVSLKPAP